MCSGAEGFRAPGNNKLVKLMMKLTAFCTFWQVAGKGNNWHTINAQRVDE
ncbi:hypothetical protein MTYM_01549 [Methylococcales bacterium]|nr:hypothetical protein MTYM_01549 [Methylococcales bacterium]